MPVSKGIDVQKSRFAALALETSSESENESAVGEWQTVKKGVVAGAGGGRKKGGAHSAGQDGGENKPLSKNAKKRARKKRQQQQQAQMASESASPGGEVVGGLEPGHPVKAVEPLWQKKNEEVMEQNFQKDLEQAILLSKLEAEKQDKVNHQIQATEQLLRTTKPPGKKKVTMSLQQLHMEKVPATADSGRHLSDSSDPTLSPVDPEFFSRLGQDVKTELKREKELERRVHVDGRQPESPSSVADDLPRIAQLQNEIEKRDKTLLHCKKENDALKKALKEVKERNQSLCMIMSQGEISSKAKLLQQIQELTTVKNDLTSEVETLHASLEQERSKNKALKSELTKLHGTRSAKST